MTAQVDPQLLLAFLPRLKNYQSTLGSEEISGSSACDDKKHLNLLIEFLETEYAPTLRKIANLVTHGEITFDLLWAILLPQSVIFTSCHTTSEPRAVRLRRISQYTGMFSSYWNLDCEYFEASEEFASTGQQFGLATMKLEIPKFDGVVKIAELSAYPIEMHPSADEVRAKLIRRGRKWVELSGVHHKQYTGVAYHDQSAVVVNGRIMIDRRKLVPILVASILNSTSLLVTFAKAEPNYSLKSARRNHAPNASIRLQDANEVMLASPILYGFSLTDKLWCWYTVAFTLFIWLIRSHSGV
jgi:hypothetical protein